MTDVTDTFKCEICGDTFEKGRTDEEAEAEFVERYPHDVGEETSVICEDCDEKFQAWMKRRNHHIN